MGCFLACFGSSKQEKRRNHRKHKLLLRQQINGSPNHLQYHTPSPEMVITADPPNVNLNADLSDGLEEESSLITRKKVTFDTNVKTYEPISVHESAELFSETEKNVGDQRGDSTDNSSLLSNSRSEDDSITSSVSSYPANHRYQNCRDSDDEIEEFICDDSDLDDENDDIEDYSDCEEDENEALEQKVWASVPTASMESRVEISSSLAAAEEVNSPMVVNMLAEKEGKSTSFNRNIHSVLNPVENIAQWKAAKSKATPFLKQQKENFTAKQEESRLSFSFMSKSDQMKDQNEHISVDASLSSWLSPTKSTPAKRTSHVEIETERSYSQGSNSAISSLIEDRPILGALTVEEIKQFSASNSPRKSPSRSPDEMAIIGTVGRYWNSSGGGSAEEDYSSVSSSYKGIPNSTSKYREDKKVIWHSTPFETRLERALKRGDIES